MLEQRCERKDPRVVSCAELADHSHVGEISGTT